MEFALRNLSKMKSLNVIDGVLIFLLQEKQYTNYWFQEL